MHTLNFNRVALLLQQRFYVHGRKILLYLGLAFGLLLFVGLLSDRGPQSGSQSFVIWYSISLYLLGSLLTLQGLPELSTADGRQTFLTLPASDTEKWFTFWLLTGPVFLVVMSFTYALYAWLVNAFLGAVGLGGLPPFELFTDSNSRLWLTYLLGVHPIALLGRIAFNRYAFAKTLGVVMGASMLFGLLGALTFRIVYYEFFEGFFSATNVNLGGDFDDTAFTILSSNWQLALFGIVVLAASYFRFHEKQV